MAQRLGGGKQFVEVERKLTVDQIIAVLNNFILNRHWTFDAREGRARFQALRFVAVSLVAFGFSLALLTVLVEAGGLAKVPAQALAVAASTPLNFLGNKLWSFRAHA